LSEDRDLPLWMRVDELMRYTATFYPSWDVEYATQLREMFGLDPKKKVGALSQGQLAKAGLLTALAHRPEFLVLDEPSSGLDPIVRRDILEAIIVTVGQEGRTVLFSSHLLDEVERTADHIAMIRKGRIVMNGNMEEVKETHHRIVVRMRGNGKQPPVIPGTLTTSGTSPEWTILCRGLLETVTASAIQGGAEIVDVTVPSLEDIFVAYAASGARSVAAPVLEVVEV
jgi:ABC-2 type transport system ATP-binding protein